MSSVVGLVGGNNFSGLSWQLELHEETSKITDVVLLVPLAKGLVAYKISKMLSLPTNLT